MLLIGYALGRQRGSGGGIDVLLSARRVGPFLSVKPRVPPVQLVLEP
jgi:hypothetical protein